MSDITVSIIIPTYNCGQYIEKCLQSLIDQKTDYIYEILVIDDGSKDNTREVCECFTSRYQNVHYLYKENTGVSDTRNKGIDIARGKYVLFVDADDYVSQDYIELIIGTAEKKQVEMVAAGYHIVFSNDNSEIVNCFSDTEIFDKNMQAAIKAFGSDGLLNVAVCKCFLRETLNKVGLRYLTEMETGEDLVFNTTYMQYIERMAVVKDAPYYYIRRDISSGVNSYKANLYDMICVCLQAIDSLYAKYQANDVRCLRLRGNFYLDYIGTGIYNLYRNECKLSFRERNIQIKRYFELDKEKIYLNSMRRDSLNRLLMILMKSGNEKVTNLIYTVLFFMRNRLNTLYLWYRNHILFRRKEKK